MYKAFYIQHLGTDRMISGFKSEESVLNATAIMNEISGIVKYQAVGVEADYIPPRPPMELVVNQKLPVKARQA